MPRDLYRGDDTIIAEGFEDDNEVAVAKAMQAAGATDRYHKEYALGGRVFRNKRRDGNHWVRAIYRRRHARKPKPSDGTDADPEGALGYVWSQYNAGHDWDPTSAELARMGMMWRQFARERWGSGWKPIPVTQITPKRIWIAKHPGYSNEQMSLDREALERDGHVHPGHWSSRSYYTEAGKEAEWREREDDLERTGRIIRCSD